LLKDDVKHLEHVCLVLLALATCCWIRENELVLVRDVARALFTDKVFALSTQKEKWLNDLSPNNDIHELPRPT
jgi:hypothetical protein